LGGDPYELESKLWMWSVRL